MSSDQHVKIRKMPSSAVKLLKRIEKLCENSSSSLHAFPYFLDWYCIRINKHFQITPGAQSVPKIFGIKLKPRLLLCLQMIFCFLIGPVAIGQANQGYVIAVVLLFFLRQIYVIYSCAKLVKIVTINENWISLLLNSAYSSFLS